uniref:Phage portal protein n=1 Tax=Parastrongyloides trichosuri TaxID=131310 RepID=A0A0N4ZQG5_PARTI
MKTKIDESTEKRIVVPPLLIQEKKSEYYFDKIPTKHLNAKKASYYLKTASKGISEYLLSDLRMYTPNNCQGGISFTDIHAMSTEYTIQPGDNINAIGNIITVDRLTKQIHNLENGFHCPIIRGGELFFVSENDDLSTAIDIDAKRPIKEYEA